MSGVLFHCSGTIVREEESGYEIEFFGMTKIYTKILKEVLHNRETERFRVDIPAKLKFLHYLSEGKILDISATGCFFETQRTEGLLRNQPSEIYFSLEGLDFWIPALIAWTHHKKEPHFDKCGIGLKFIKKQNNFMDFLYDWFDLENFKILLKYR